MSIASARTGTKTYSLSRAAVFPEALSHGEAVVTMWSGNKERQTGGHSLPQFLLLLV